MAYQRSLYNFEEFPRKQLTIPISRRGFVKATFEELGANRMKSNGGQVFRTADLGELPDQEIGAISPIIIPGSIISVKDKMMMGKPLSVLKPISLFPLDSPAQVALYLFDGMTSLEAIASQLAARFDWEISYSFCYARGVFLQLVEYGLCCPG